MTADASNSRRFDVALSFPGEHRDYVEQVAGHLAAILGQERVLYDQYHDAEFARTDLDVYLPNLYRTQSELIVLFLCPQYAAKRWCGLECRFIRQLIGTPEAKRIMFLSFGRTGDYSEFGILSGDGYIDILPLKPQTVAEKILKRLRLNQGITPPSARPDPAISELRQRLIAAKAERELQALLFEAQALSPTAQAKLLIADIEKALEHTRRVVCFANERITVCDISRILKYAPEKLIGRDDELKLLNDAWTKTQNRDPKHPRILTFVALGGEGKTSLVAKWAAELAAQDWPGCDAAFAWSFYSQGTREQLASSSDLFLKAALTFFGDDADQAFAASPAGAFEKGQRLARLVGQRRSLLILDGLEPLQYAPTAPTPGELKDQGVAALLKGLAAASHGLCVVTTRYSLPDLKAFWQTTAPEVKLPHIANPQPTPLPTPPAVTNWRLVFLVLLILVGGIAQTSVL